MNYQRGRMFLAPLLAAAFLAGTSGLGAAPSKDSVQKIIQARDKLQEGWNTWNQETMKSARDLFLNLIIQDKENVADLHYYAALGEYRLAAYAFSVSKADDAAVCVGQAKKYLEKTMELQPNWGEPYALYASLLGYEIAMHPDRGMELGMKTFSFFGQAESKDPQNPRVRLLKGLSLFYSPAQYGGGPDNAIPVLEQAVALFEKEKPVDPLKPTWGLEETLTFLAMAHQQKGEREAAIDCLKKALAANPDYMLAQQELKKLQAEK